MNRGTVFFHKQLIFQDGEQGRKLLVILNTPKTGESYLCCKTTSRCQYNLQSSGCYSGKNIFVLDPIPGCFSKKTWIQFHEYYEFTSTDLLDLHFRGKVVVVGNLPDRIITAIVECVKNSPDISKYHLSLL